MFFLDLLFALVIAILLTALFGLLFRRMAMGTGLLLFFLVLFLASWAGGVWLTPFGPPLFGVSWLSFLFIGLFVALILTALIPPVRPPRTLEEARVQAETEAETTFIIDIFFWILLLGLLVVIVITYI